MTRLPRRLLFSVAMLALPIHAMAGSATPACGIVQPTAATPMMSRHAALKWQAEAELLGKDPARCRKADRGAGNGANADDDAGAAGRRGDEDDSHGAHHASASGCQACPACGTPAAMKLPSLALSQYRHMPPRSPLGTLANATPDSLFPASPARC